MEIKDLMVKAGLRASDINCHDLPESLILALIWVESTGNRFAMRYEDGFKWVTDVASHARMNGVTPETERVLQKTSFGLLQIMGGTARDIGYKKSLAQLLEPATNVKWATQHLRGLCGRWPDWEDVISAYNQGSPRRTPEGEYKNQRYVNRVMTAWQKYEM